MSAAATRFSVFSSLAALAFDETHLPYAFLPFSLVPQSANASGSASRSALHSWAAFLSSVSATTPCFARHAFVAFAALLAA